NKNRKVTAADSTYSPMNNAPTTAIVTRSSILKAFIMTDWIAFFAIDQPATTVATMSAVFFQKPRSNQWSKNAVSNKIPEIITTGIFFILPIYNTSFLFIFQELPFCSSFVFPCCGSRYDVRQLLFS